MNTIMIRGTLAAALLWPCTAYPAPRAGAPAEMTVQVLVERNLVAAGGAEALAKIRTFDFAAGPLKYSASADGRLKVRSVFEEPAVFESVLVDGTAVRRNTLGRKTELHGMEKLRWIALARFLGGLGTLKPFTGGLSYEGVRSFGAEAFHVCSAGLTGGRATFYVDASDFLVKRLVVSGVDDDGAGFEESIELGFGDAIEGLRLPTTIYIARVGVGGTYSAYADPSTDFVLDAALPPGFFDANEVDPGPVEISPGVLRGRILSGRFYDEDFFVRIFSNWSADDVRAAGFGNGDVLVFSAAGVEFEAKLFYLESEVVDPTVYDPGRAFFTHRPQRYPMFFIQFNTLAPRERYDDFKDRIKALIPIEARRKS